MKNTAQEIFLVLVITVMSVTAALLIAQTGTPLWL
jgi:hypothetical protein